MRMIPVSVLAVLMAGTNVRPAEGSALVSWISEHNPFSGWSWGNGNQGQQGSNKGQPSVASSSVNLRSGAAAGKELALRTGVQEVDALLEPWSVEYCTGDLRTDIGSPKTVLARSLNNAKRETLVWWYTHRAVFQSILGSWSTEYRAVEAHAKRAAAQRPATDSEYAKSKVMDALNELGRFQAGSLSGSCPVVAADMTDMLTSFTARYVNKISDALRHGKLQSMRGDAQDALNTAGNAVLANLETHYDF